MFPSPYPEHAPLEVPAVGWHDLPALQEDHVLRHEQRALQGAEAAVALHGVGADDAVLKEGGAILRLWWWCDDSDG